MPTAVAPSGSGTSGDPYIIATLNNLYWVTQNSLSWDKYFEQSADIDASETMYWDGGEGFSPIGTTALPYFTGNYNGNGHKITNLYINRETEANQGLFGICSGAVISNLTVETAYIRGSNNSGILIGYSHTTTISNCNVTGSVYGEDCVGAIAGRMEYGSITGGYSTGYVSGDSRAGGVVGNAYNASFNKCFSVGNVEAITSAVGGFIGRSAANTITNCYSFGNVSCDVGMGDGETGGFVGASYDGTTSYCYSTGEVEGPVAGGLCGSNTGTVFTACFWDTETSEVATSDGGTGKTTEEMKDTITYGAWDLTTIWALSKTEEINDGYPFFIPTAPSTQASNITISMSRATSARISWTRGDGDSCLVFMREEEYSFMANPIDYKTYSADSVFEAGEALGDWYCIYAGTGTSVDVDNLKPNKAYTISVVEMSNVVYYGAPGNYINSSSTNNPKTYDVPSQMVFVYRPKEERWSTLNNVVIPDDVISIVRDSDGDYFLYLYNNTTIYKYPDKDNYCDYGVIRSKKFDGFVIIGRVKLFYEGSAPSYLKLRAYNRHFDFSPKIYTISSPENGRWYRIPYSYARCQQYEIEIIDAEKPREIVIDYDEIGA